MRKRYARHNQVAVFDTVDEAMVALDALDQAGFRPAETSLLAPDREKRPGAHVIREARVHTVTGLGPGLLTGLLIGAAVGAVVTAAATMLAAAVLDMALSLSGAALVGAVVGATMGSVAGGLLGVDAAGRKAAMWEQSLEPIDHVVQDRRQVLVGVHSDDRERADEGGHVLEQTGPVDVHTLDAELSFEPPGRYAANLGRVVPSGSAEAPGSDLDHGATVREADQAAGEHATDAPADPPNGRRSADDEAG